MGLKVKNLATLSIFSILVALSSGTLDRQFKTGIEHFSNNIFQELIKTHGQKNIIFSPLSAHTCLAMVRMGSDGETAAELDRAMGFTGQSPETIAENYFKLMSHYENTDMLQLANKLYIMKDYELQKEYNEILVNKFHSSAESIDFSQSEKAAAAINNWVELKTNHLIKDMISSEILSSDTRLVLLNAIHFKGEWVKPFNPEDTEMLDFFYEEEKSIEIEMMYMVDNFEFADFYDWKFSAVRLPYKDSDLSMIIFSPMERMGLSNMLKLLKTLNLEDITKKLKHQICEIMLPKFKAEFEIELTDTLKKLHLNRLFTNGDLSKMLKSSELLEISHVLQKAFIEVTEMGTVAAASSAAEAQSRMMPPGVRGDHPFHYMIVNTENVVLFQGNVVKF